MKAVNLIPSDARRAGAAGGPSGGIASYALLGFLGVLVLMMGAFTLAKKQVDDRAANLARVENQAKSTEAAAAKLAPYTKFTSLSQARTDTVKQLVDGRFDWSHALREIARIVPREADLVDLTASSAAGTAGANGTPLRSALPVPAFDITGCTVNQSRVATLLARLRAVDGVLRVSLAESEKSDQGNAGSESDCRTSDRRPQFKMTVFFRGKPALVPQAPPAAGAAPGAAPPATQTASTPAPADPSQSVPVSAGGAK